MFLLQFFIKAKVYFNEAAPPAEFRLPDGTISLTTLTFKLNELLPDTDNENKRKIEFPEDWIDIDGRVKYNLIELKTNEDLTVMWRSFRCRLTKGLIELDAKISRFVDDIIKMLKCPKSSGSV
ncbi:uncharacterized protein LOC127136509 [Lathyrus oleraceus]|uniref:uncharacterized protein LOC127136509 n=1 Tax=Pisum sativum TaxID=3888 RepID=UPI0021D20190|nr:uncharacterized protein LOC127136509 [Pisum sativum]